MAPLAFASLWPTLRFGLRSAKSQNMLFKTTTANSAVKSTWRFLFAANNYARCVLCVDVLEAFSLSVHSSPDGCDHGSRNTDRMVCTSRLADTVFENVQ
jgi:hypothetical protein